MEFKIEHTWDSLPVNHEPVTIQLKAGNAGLLMEVGAPFFNDPPAPPGQPGKPFNGLWDYEVVEAFFLSDETEQYLEVELSPHGQHLVLLLSSRRKIWKQELTLTFEVTRTNMKWDGRVHIPWSYFPSSTNKFNAYAIHGSEAKRTYEALYHVPPHEIQEGQKPDFHYLECFRHLNLKELMGEDWKQPVSNLWLSSKHAN
uniref:Chromosome 4 open reading frame 33 n=1 Tax=Sphenodon punctatus TaxID=8508 RepID=A0A8D0H7E4_SPHPU